MPDPAPSPDYLESFDEWKERSVPAELEALKKEIDESLAANKLENTDDETKKLNKLNALKTKSADLKTRIDESAAGWKERLGTAQANRELRDKIDSFVTESNAKIDEVLALGGEADKLQDALNKLNDLKTKVDEEAKENVGDPETLVEAIKTNAKQSDVEGAEEESKKAEKKGLAGMLGGLMEKIEPLLKMFMSLSIEFKKIMTGMNPFAKSEDRAKAEAEISEMEKAFEERYGKENWRFVFNERAKELGHKLVFKKDEDPSRDQAAWMEVKAKFEEARKRERNLTMEEYADRLVGEYMRESAAGMSADGELVTTMRGLLLGRRPKPAAEEAS